ncbi:MAG TPA: CvpA family protein [Gemmataceae bacterium]|nr:CvpA family protein [Gemmataceae bacterium]
MWIMVFALLIMIGCAYAQYRNGLFSSIAMLFMVLLSGLVAFGFWEPIADLLDPIFQNNALTGCEDMIVMVLLFALTLFLLRLALTYLNPEMIEQHGHLQQLGALVVGLVMGYFLSGFLICAMQTLPLDVNFFDFEPRETNEAFYRPYYPPDRVWLALMRQESAGAYSWKEEPAPKGDSGVDRYVTFDREGTFELRYTRYRRNTDARGPLPYFGELDLELKGKKR